ncbi:hypothetical protein JCM33374_g5475 [Metschnikowia sp. JCM 33374]|nr:hypothetical protein JCM33374_g5475 [Metschnikowia sp. JCM 33374]
MYPFNQVFESPEFQHEIENKILPITSGNAPPQYSQDCFDVMKCRDLSSTFEADLKNWESMQPELEKFNAFEGQPLEGLFEELNVDYNSQNVIAAIAQEFLDSELHSQIKLKPKPIAKPKLFLKLRLKPKLYLRFRLKPKLYLRFRLKPKLYLRFRLKPKPQPKPMHKVKPKNKNKLRTKLSSW